MFSRYPKIEFFHTDEIRVMMVDALFIYAKLNPEVAYRQVRVRVRVTEVNLE